MDFFHRNEAEQFAFYRIPKLLFTNPKFNNISCEAKLIYGLMLDRMSLSNKNNWVDENDNVYIIFSNEEVAQMLNCGVKKVIKLISELKYCKLIEVKRQGLGKPNLIFVKNFATADNSINKNALNTTSEIKKDEESHNSTKTPQEQEETSHKKSTVELYREILKEQLEYDIIVQNNKSIIYRERIDEIIEIMLEVLTYKNDYINIGENKINVELFKSRIWKMTYSDIEYILTCLDKTNSKITNIKSYLLTVIYNCRTTMSNYYNQWVNNDIYGGG